MSTEPGERLLISQFGPPIITGEAYPFVSEPIHDPKGIRFEERLLASSRMAFYLSFPAFLIGGGGIVILLMDPLHIIQHFDWDTFILLAGSPFLITLGTFYVRAGMRSRRPRRVLLIDERDSTASITIRWGSKQLVERYPLTGLTLSIHNARFVDGKGRERMLIRYRCPVVLAWCNDLWFVLGGSQDREQLIRDVLAVLPFQFRDRLTEGTDIVSKGIIR